jgi:hypothetical protein
MEQLSTTAPQNESDPHARLLPRIWKQRGGHTGSRYLADKDQVSKGLLHALRDHESRRVGLGLKADESVDGYSRARNTTADKSLLVMSAAIAHLQKRGRTG